MFSGTCAGPHCSHEFDSSVLLRDINMAKSSGETPYIEYVDDMPEDEDLPYEADGAYSWRFCSLLCFQQWLDEQDQVVVERPASWPESYPAFGRSPECDHYMQWVPKDGHYECIRDCGETDDHPPEGKLEA